MSKWIDESFVMDMFWRWLRATRYYKKDFLLENTESSAEKLPYLLPSYKSQTLATGLFFWLIYAVVIVITLFDLKRWGWDDLFAGLALFFIWAIVVEICGLMWVFINMGAGFGHWIGRTFAKSILGYWLISITTDELFWLFFAALVLGLNGANWADIGRVTLGMGLFHLVVMLIWWILYAYTVYFSSEQESSPSPPISSGNNLDEHLLDGDEDI